ncbi:MAG: Mur ligase domain-containing protein, partial [Methyloligellaceae bacterium]
MKLHRLAGPEIELGERQAELDITGLTADSREVRPGYLFAALPGSVMDGTKFIPSALEKGASAILMADDREVVIPDGIAVIKVSNPRKFLAVFAS